MFANAASMIFSIARDPHDGEGLVQPIRVVDRELPPQRILPGKEVLDHRLVHHRHSRRSRSILRFDAAASQNGNSHCAEISRANVIFHGNTIAVIAGLKPGYDDRVA